MREVRAFLALFFALQLSSGAMMFQGNSQEGSWVFSRSWGLGLTVPNGGVLEDGSEIEWSKHSNITIVLTLPNISYTDNTIYLVASIMTRGETIIQTTIGIQPNNTFWVSSFMYVTNVYKHNRAYVPVLLNSNPYFSPGDKASISIYFNGDGYTAGSWSSSVTNLSTGEEITVNILQDGSSTFMDGEQEVVALESYTSNEEVFRRMGHATLHSILVDGRRVVSGWYIDDGQVFDRKPLFEVGGGQVPPFISMIAGGDGLITWTYSKPSWNDSINPHYSLLLIPTFIILTIVIVYAAYRIKA